MTNAIEQLTDAIEAHGYTVSMEPIPGSEELFTQSLREAFASIERCMAHGQKHYGTRGLSKRAISNLHSLLPEPVWGVEVSA